ncbi:IS3 family transposase, partial [Jeotgalicoccus psychrophilus]|uniref:IS3 family transposase n=1 Tax=Jeotgalicoccus psychrophilus TaxID=157228 RepID=UPI0012EC8FA6
MCKVLQISRSTYYFKMNKQRTHKQYERDNEINETIIQVFNSNRKCFGTRRIKNALDKQGLIVSRRRIGRIMKQNNLVSTYTV